MDVMNLKRGQHLIMELENETVCGIFENTNNDKTCLTLKNVTDYRTNEDIASTSFYYKNEIKSIIILDHTQAQEEINETLTSTLTTTSPYLNKSILVRKDLLNIQDRVKNFQFIAQTDKYYQNAIKDMANSEKIAISTEISAIYSRTSLLTVATQSGIYIFDLFSLGNIYPELKRILEANVPQKVLHNGRILSDNLYYQYKIQLNNVSDTMIAHMMIRKDTKIISIEDCLSHYLRVPYGLSGNLKNSSDYNKRPLTDEDKLLAAQKVAFLLKLNDYLLNQCLFKPYYDSCQSFARSYENNDPFKICYKSLTNNEVSSSYIKDFDINGKLIYLSDIHSSSDDGQQLISLESQ